MKLRVFLESYTFDIIVSNYSLSAIYQEIEDRFAVSRKSITDLQISACGGIR